jgi:hypothetical protein
MPRSLGVQERTKRWDNSETAKFQGQVNSGIIDIDDVTPTTIEEIRTNHGWSYRSRENFRTNYKRVAAKLRVARDYNGARAAGSEEAEEGKILLTQKLICSLSHWPSFTHILYFFRLFSLRYH